MDYTRLPLFSLMKAKLNYSSERQAILAQNVANADTPGYRAKDIKEPNFASVLAGQQGGLSMTTTSAGHMTTQASSGGKFQIENRASTYELSPVGNNVSIIEEMQRVSQNQGEYQRVLNLYRKSIAMFKNALGVPNNG